MDLEKFYHYMKKFFLTQMDFSSNNLYFFRHIFEGDAKYQTTDSVFIFPTGKMKTAYNNLKF